MLDQDVIELLESGCALTVGFVAADGRPVASRGWGLTLRDDGRRARLLVPKADVTGLDHGPGGPVGTWIATTGSNVATLRSAQLKGPIRAIEPLDARDRERLDRYCDAFFHDIEVVDGFPRRLAERMVPAELAACEFDVVEAYDQTPGPGAGSELRGGGDGA